MNEKRTIGVLVAAALAVGLAACSSSSRSGTEDTRAPRPDRVVTSLGTSTGAATRSGNLDFYLDERYESMEVPSASAEYLWPALLGAYEDLELGMGAVDTEAYMVGNPNLTVSRRLAGHRMSRLFRCGNSMTGPVADDSRITVNVETRIAEVEGGSVVSTLVLASAMPSDGTGTVRPCTSSGLLEEEIHEALLKRLVTGSAGPF